MDEAEVAGASMRDDPSASASTEPVGTECISCVTDARLLRGRVISGPRSIRLDRNVDLTAMRRTRVNLTGGPVNLTLRRVDGQSGIVKRGRGLSTW